MASAREYRLVARLADTDHGEAWRGVAIDAEQRPSPALLLVLAPHAATGEVLSALTAQLKAIAGVVHPGLALPFELGTAGGRTILAGPFVEGHDLGVVLGRLRAREIAIPLQRAVHIVAEAANAVAALHAAGAIHGSLAPTNLVLGFDGNVAVSCVNLRPALETDRTTRTLALRGRKAYRAPELARNVRPDALTDVYALGAMAYELTTGKSLESAGHRGTSTRSDSLPPPSRVDRRIPMKFDGVVGRALETARPRRYRNAAELRDALWNYLDTMGQVVTPAEMTEMARTVLANEVVQYAFDPNEPASGTVPVGGTFILEPIRFEEAAPPRRYAMAAEAEPAAAPAPAPVHAQETVRISVPELQAAEASAAAAGLAAEAPPLTSQGAAVSAMPTDPGALGSAMPHEAGLDTDIASLPGITDPYGMAPPTVADADAVAKLSSAEPAKTVSDMPALTGAGAAPPVPTVTEADAARPPAGAVGSPPARPVSRTGMPAASRSGAARTARTATGPNGTLRLAAAVPRRRSPWPYVVAGVGAALLVAGGGFYLLHGQRNAGAQATGPASPAARTGLADAHRASPVDPPARHAAPPPPAPKVAPVPARRRARTSPTPAARAPTRGHRYVAPATAHARGHRHRRRHVTPRGRLTIYSSRRSRVLIDGHPIHRHTPLVSYPVAAGNHQITLVDPTTGSKRTARVYVRARHLTKLRVSID